MNDGLRAILPVFTAELGEQLLRISDALLALEGRGPGEADPSVLAALLRDTHSIKGTSASFGFDDLAGAAHALEDLFVPVREGKAGVDANLVNVSLEALEALRRRADGLAAGSDTEGREALLAVTVALRAAAKAGGPAGEVAPAAPTARVGAPAAAAGPAVPAEETMRVARHALQRLDRQVEAVRGVRGRLVARKAATLALARDLAPVLRALPDRRQARQLRRRLAALARLMSEDEALVAGTAADLAADLRAVQLTPLSGLLDPLRSAVAAHVRQVGKKVRFEVEDGHALVDRRLFESLKDPLVHLLRNAVDHGLETPEARAAARKPEEGVLAVRATPKGAFLELAVRDDGRGIDVEAVKRKALRAGLLTPDEAEQLTEAAATQLLFRSGFSTAEQVTATSGRGVGLDAVAAAVTSLGGRVQVQSRPGEGATFVLSVPSALTSEQLLLVEAGGRTVGLRLAGVERLLRVQASEVEAVSGGAVVKIAGEPLPLKSLAAALGLPDAGTTAARFVAVVMRLPSRERVVARVDAVKGNVDAVLQPVPHELAGLKHLAAVADPGDGRLLYVVAPDFALEGEAAVAAPQRKTVLVVDDSLSTRALHRQALEAAGLRVFVAGNGEEGLRLLEREAVDLVITDLEMPILDGGGMLQRLRAVPRLAALPAILVTSLAASDPRAAAAIALADAFVTKAAYERGGLLDAVRRLLGGRAR